MIARTAAAYIMAAVLCISQAASSPPQTKLGTAGAADEYRDRMIYEAIAWTDMLNQAKDMQQATQMRNMGIEVHGLNAFWKWKLPDALETQAQLQSCRTAALGAFYALNDYAEVLVNKHFNEPDAVIVEWYEKFRLSLSTYEREWPKCERAFPAEVKTMRKAYEASPIRP